MATAQDPHQCADAIRSVEAVSDPLFARRDTLREPSNVFAAVV